MLTTIIDGSTPIAVALREKLSSATIVSQNDVNPRVVTLNSRVLFQVDDGPIQSRVVIHDDKRRVEGLTIPIASSRGLALLGLTEGQRRIVHGPGSRSEKLRIVTVAFQPEAVEREAAASRFFSETGSRPTAEIVTFGRPRVSANGSTRRLQKSDDDWDPPAA